MAAPPETLPLHTRLHTLAIQVEHQAERMQAYALELEQRAQNFRNHAQHLHMRATELEMKAGRARSRTPGEYG